MIAQGEWGRGHNPRQADIDATCILHLAFTTILAQPRLHLLIKEE
jgi:hypothetical protein